LHRRCLHCHAAANFIDAPPLPSSLHPRFCLLRRAAVAFIIAPLLIVAPPLPSSSHRRCLPRCAAAPFLVVPPVLPLSTRCHCLCHRAAAAFIVAPPFLPSSSGRRFCLCRRAAAHFIDYSYCTLQKLLQQTDLQRNFLQRNLLHTDRQTPTDDSLIISLIETKQTLPPCQEHCSMDIYLLSLNFGTY